MEKTKTLELINNALRFDMNQDSATAYGLHHDGDNLKCEVITRSADVYDLISSLSDFENVKSFDYLSIITWGWAAPLNSNGEVDGAPSKHPQKRRVQLIISGSSSEKGLVGSILNFSDEPDSPVFDFGDATGSLSDAFTDFFRGE
jgi:hypothetical protein